MYNFDYNDSKKNTFMFRIQKTHISYYILFFELGIRLEYINILDNK